MALLKYVSFFFTLFYSFQTYASGIHFDKIMIVIFENTNFNRVISQPFFKRLADEGVLLNNMNAITHPSQGNYIAMTSGDLHGVRNDKDVNLDVSHIGDLLEAKGLNWKVYSEDYPGNCFLGNSGLYKRKHNPFISYINVQKSPERCARIVNADQLDKDIQEGNLPEYAFYVPNMKNDGHDSNMNYASSWYEKRFGPLLNNPQFIDNMLLVTTFDETGPLGANRIYTSLYGNMVKAGTVFKDKLTHYSILRLIEDEFGLGDLGQNDTHASTINNVWK